MEPVVLLQTLALRGIEQPPPVSPGPGVHDGLAAERFQQLMRPAAPEEAPAAPAVAAPATQALEPGAAWQQQPKSLGDAILKTFDALAADGRANWSQLMSTPLRGLDTSAMFEFQRTVIKFTVTSEYFGKGVGKVVQNTESVVRQTT